jgi:hypothetical protein
MNNSSAKELLLASLTTFYSKENNIKRILNIVDNNGSISLRLIDWYVTNYCKKYNIVYTKEQEYFNVYMNYRAQLKAFKKLQFDPFRRRDRIVFHYSDKKNLNTTIGQLNFFRWAIENKVLENIENNMENIEKDMLLSQKTVKSNTKKRIEISKSSIKNMTKYNGDMMISFG